MRDRNSVKDALLRLHTIGSLTVLVPDSANSDEDIRSFLENFTFKVFKGTLDGLLQNEREGPEREQYLDRLFGFRTESYQNARTTAVGAYDQFVMLPSGKSVFFHHPSISSGDKPLFCDVLDIYRANRGSLPEVPQGMIVPSSCLRGPGEVFATRERWKDKRPGLEASSVAPRGQGGPGETTEGARGQEGGDDGVGEEWPDGMLAREEIEPTVKRRRGVVYYTWNSPLLCTGLGLYRFAERLSALLQEYEKRLIDTIEAMSKSEFSERLETSREKSIVKIIATVSENSPVLYNAILRVDREAEMMFDRSSNFGAVLTLKGDSVTVSLSLE